MIKIHPRHLIDASRMTQEELETLQAKMRQVQHRSPAPPPLVPLFGPGSPSTPTGVGPHLREWCCPAPCGKIYRAARCQKFCPECEQKQIHEQRDHRRRQIHTLVMALAGDDFQHATLQHPQLQEWVASAMAITKAKIYADLEYDDSRDRWSQMVLLGGTGVGKTTLGTAVFRHHADRVLAPGATDSDETYVRSMLWISAVQLGTARRETRLGHAVTLIDRALSAAVLMLDDLGQETADSRDDIKFVLIERQRHRRRTIVTTGFQLEQLGKEYGEHIQRRLVERSHVLQIQAKKNSSLKGSGTTP